MLDRVEKSLNQHIPQMHSLIGTYTLTPLGINLTREQRSVRTNSCAPTKMTRWLSDFLVGRVIQVNVNSFLSGKISPMAGVPQGSVLSPLFFLIYISDLPKPHHRQNSKSQFPDDTALWAANKNVQFAAKPLCKDLRKLAKWCAKWRIKLNPEKNQGRNILQVPSRQKVRTHSKTVWRETRNLSSSEISMNHFRLQIHFPKTL